MGGGGGTRCRQLQAGKATRALHGWLAGWEAAERAGACVLQRLGFPHGGWTCAEAQTRMFYTHVCIATMPKQT